LLRAGLPGRAGCFFGGPLGDGLQRADGRLDVADVELAQQPGGGAADVLAQITVQGFPFGGQVNVSAAADQSLGFQAGEKFPGGAGIQVP
jgi:hypothetical protein